MKLEVIITITIGINKRKIDALAHNNEIEMHLIHQRTLVAINVYTCICFH